MASGEMSEGGKKKSSGIGGLLFYMVPVVAVAAMLIFGGLFLRDYISQCHFYLLFGLYFYVPPGHRPAHGGSQSDGSLSAYTETPLKRLSVLHSITICEIRPRISLSDAQQRLTRYL